MTSTPIAPEDLCSKIESDVNWKTTKFPAVISWPKDIQEHPDDGLWATYFRRFDQENASDQPHDGSRNFYRENRSAMDEGAEVFDPGRFKPDEHESALQALLEKRHLIGDAAF